MNIKERTIQEITDRLNKIDNLIANKGVGSQYLDKAKRIQRNLNITLLAVGVVTVAGIAIWAANSRD
jgi:cytoskeletal protein RodZ